MEEIYYADLLSKAAQAESTLEELSYLGAFVLSAYAHTIYRVGKPFNPLLGETYECDRRAECGWRCFMEQVSQQIPVAMASKQLSVALASKILNERHMTNMCITG